MQRIVAALRCVPAPPVNVNFPLTQLPKLIRRGSSGPCRRYRGHAATRRSSETPHQHFMRGVL